jgi:hypothetical protein
LSEASEFIHTPSMPRCGSMYQNVSIASWCSPVDCPPALTAQMLNQPAFLIVPSGFSTIRVWLRGRFEIGSCAEAENAGTARSKASARVRSARIVFSLVSFFSLTRVKRRPRFSVNRNLDIYQHT